jgi:hypothetical protein
MTHTTNRVGGGDVAAPHPNVAASPPARRLQQTMAAARVSFTWLGTRRSLTPQQRQQAAETFSAEGRYVSAGKKLLDTSHPAFRAVTAVRGRAVGYWRGVSLPYPEPGVRLIRQERLEPFDRRMRELREELTEAVGELDGQYAALRADARQRLGRLFDDRDYPPSLRTLFELQWDFPAVAPPEYLKQLSPALYQQEAARVAARFEEAVSLAEQAFAGELSKLLSHLCGRLAGGEDGKPKVFRDSAVENLSEFFQRFRQLNVRSSPQLDELVERAQRVVRGTGADDLRGAGELRHRVAGQLAAVQAQLDGLLVDRPRRKILRAAAAGPLTREAQV